MDRENAAYTPEELIRNFAAVAQYVRIYTVPHQLSRNKIKEFHEYLKEYFSHALEHTFIFGVVMGELVSGEEILIGSSKMLKPFIALLEQRRIEKITIDQQCSLEELALFIELLTDTKAYPVEKPIGESMAAQGITHIKTGTLSTEERNASKAAPELSKTYLPQYYASLITSVGELLQRVFSRTADDKDSGMFIELISQIMTRLDDDPEGLFRIFGYLKSRNEYEYIHSAHVAILCLIQARSLGLDKRTVSEIGISGFLHDVGKLSIPLEILNKPSALTHDEFQIMKQHPTHGAQILAQYAPVFGELPVIVSFQHHLGYNGSGYPEGLSYSKELNLASRIATVADVYDALRSNRSYRTGMAPERVYTMMRDERGRSFDPFLLDNFFSIMGIWPPGAIVELSNRLIGVVQAENSLFLDKPIVEVFFDNSAGKTVEPYRIDLEKEESLQIEHSLGLEKLQEKQIPIPSMYLI